MPEIIANAWQWLWWGLYIFMELCGLVLAVHALMHTRSPQAVLAWMLALVIFPLVGVPLYLMFGRDRLAGYVKARQSQNQKFHELYQKAFAELSCWQWPVPPRLQALAKMAGVGFTHANRCELLINGESTFAQVFDSMYAAKKSIVVEFFIVENDALGSDFLALLAQKARDGLNVYFIYDDVGSHKFRRSNRRMLEQAGVNVLPFGGRRRLWGNLFHVNFRNHRKLVVIDGSVAFLGGLNIGEDYVGNGPLGAWRDTFLRLQGPASLAVQLAFSENWFWASQGQVPEVPWPKPVAPKDVDSPVLILPSAPADSIPTWKMAVIYAANSAKHRLWIASPYFVPDDGVLQALNAAAMRGVDVRVLLSHQRDHWLVHLASFSYYPDCMPYGTRIFRYRRGFLHQKVVLVDHNLAIVGTANLDNRSLMLNFEISAVMAGHDDVARVAAMLQRDFKHSTEHDLRDFADMPLLFRMAVRASRLFAPVL